MDSVLPRYVIWAVSRRKVHLIGLSLDTRLSGSSPLLLRHAMCPLVVGQLFGKLRSLGGRSARYALYLYVGERGISARGSQRTHPDCDLCEELRK